MQGKKYVIGLALLAVLVLLNLPVPATARLKRGVRDGIAPFQNLSFFLFHGLGEAVASAGESRTSRTEKQQLVEQVANLQHEVRDLRRLERDNDELRKLLEYRDRQKYRLILCEVIARGDASGWWQTLTLNRGSDDGLEPGSAVVTPEGLIGRTQEISRRTSDVLLITDPNCRVSCELATHGAYGILKGKETVLTTPTRLEMFTPLQPCQMDYIDKDKPAVPGEDVLTSGLGGLFPKGLPVGKISRVQIDESKLYLRAEVTPSARLGALRYVFVVLQAPSTGEIRIE